jgi:uncharacterized protein (DUF1697 family)
MNYAALIRWIMPGNPQMRNTELCRVIESLGHKNVKAIISSGNVVFSSSQTDEQAIEKQISIVLKDELGIPVPAIVRSQKELKMLEAANPLGAQTHTKNNYLTVIFLMDQAERTLVDHPDIMALHTSAREQCIVTNPDILPGPKAMQIIEKTYGKSITTRTWKTVERIITTLETIE